MAEKPLAPPSSTLDQSCTNDEHLAIHCDDDFPSIQFTSRQPGDATLMMTPEQKLRISETNAVKVLALCMHDTRTHDAEYHANGREIKHIKREACGCADLLVSIRAKYLDLKEKTTAEDWDTITNTWHEIATDKKRSILRDAWGVEHSTLNTSHRADIALLVEHGVFSQFALEKAKHIVLSNIEAFIWPDLNEEDLLEDDNILKLLESRSQHAPSVFTHFDLGMLRLYHTTHVKPFRYVYQESGDGKVGLVGYIDSECFPGIHIPASGRSDSKGGCVTLMGNVLDACDRQLPLMIFLVNFRNMVLRESELLREDPNFKSVDKFGPQSPSDKSDEPDIRDWRRSLRYPYLSPVIDSLDTCIELTQTRLEEARDQLLGLRECPRTFQAYTKMFEKSDLEWVKDKDGKEWLGPVSESTKFTFRNKSITQAIVAPFQEILMWDAVSSRLDKARKYKRGTPGSLYEMRNLKVFLEGTMLPHLLHKLRMFLLTSTSMRPYVYRTTTRIKKKLEHSFEFREAKFEKLVSDKLMWVMFQLSTGKDVGLEGVDSVAAIIELRRLIESGKEPTIHVSATVYPLIADLALYAELWVQSTAYAATIFYHSSAYDEETEMVASLYDGRHWKELQNELAALWDDDDEMFALGHTVHHTEDTLEYPIDKPRTKATTAAMQKAESNLDNFWNEFDSHVKKYCSERVSGLWDIQWPQKEDLKRTQDWAETNVALGGKSIPFRFGDEADSATGTNRSLKKKNQKKKKRKNGKAEGSLDADITTTHIPATAQEPITHIPATAQEPTTQRPPVKISKEAYQTVQGGLFYAPGNSDNTSEVRWSEFLTVMKSLGFTAKTMFGSVWRFEPGEKAKASGFVRSINFHEPHGREATLNRALARRIGRRLTRAYGIDLSNLVVEE